MDMQAYIQLIKRWFWLIGLAALLAGGIAFYVARSQSPVFQTSTTIQVGAFQELPNPNPQVIQSAQGLAQSYFVLTKTYPYLEALAQKLSLPDRPEDLIGAFELHSIPDTPFFTITVTYRDANTAALIANTIAAELVARTVATAETRNAQIDDLQRQIDNLSGQLQKDEDELKAIEERLKQDELSDPILMIRQNELISRINQQRATLASFQTNLIALQNQSPVNVLTVVEPARVPERGISVSAVRDSLLAAAIGGLLSIGIIVVLEQLNTSIKSPGDVVLLLRLPVLGTIPLFGRRRTLKRKLVTRLQPQSAAAESFRALRVNLMFMENEENKSGGHSYVITSSRKGEGKSVIAANLAVSFANMGRRVVLIDANLRRPMQHMIFDLANTSGLSDIIQHEPSVDHNPRLLLEGDPTTDQSFFETYKDTDERALIAVTKSLNFPFYTIPSDLPIHKTEIPHLYIMTSGPAHLNPADLLGNLKVKELARHLVDKEGFDIVIFDTPPVLEVSDSGMLAGVLDAPILLVAEAGSTGRTDLATAVQRFSMLSVPVIGVVLNRAKYELEGTGQALTYENGRSVEALPTNGVISKARPQTVADQVNGQTPTG